MRSRVRGWALLLLTCSALQPASALPPGVFGSREGKPDDPSTIRDCTIVRWEREATAYPKMFIGQPGKYCLDRDYVADLRFCSHGCRGEFIDIRANDVELDLRGHTLHAVLKPNTFNYSGIVAIGNNITIRNGRIKGAGAGVTYRAPPPDPLPPNAKSPSIFEITQEQSPSRIAVYGPGGARIENLVIEDTAHPIAVAGANVTAIGNRISSVVVVDPMLALLRRDPQLPRQFTETSPPGAISIFGPGSVVADNTIEQTNRTGGQLLAYSILLRDAKGAVVRNNRIRNSGSSDKTVAVGLKDSTDVVLEDNTLVNIDKAVAVLGTGSTFVQRP